MRIKDYIILIVFLNVILFASTPSFEFTIDRKIKNFKVEDVKYTIYEINEDSSGDLIIPDSDKFQVGAGLDMSLYHDGTNSYITNKTGKLSFLIS